MIIGQPKTIAEFAPLQPQEFNDIQAQVGPALAQGASPETPIQIDLGTLCRLLSTIGNFATAIAQLQQMVAPPTTETPEVPTELPPLPVLRPMGSE